MTPYDQFEGSRSYKKDKHSRLAEQRKETKQFIEQAKKEEWHNELFLKLNPDNIEQAEKIVRLAIRAFINESSNFNDDRQKTFVSLPTDKQEAYLIWCSINSSDKSKESDFENDHKVKHIQKFLNEEITIEQLTKKIGDINLTGCGSINDFDVGYVAKSGRMFIHPHRGRQKVMSDKKLISIVEKVEIKAKELNLEYKACFKNLRS